MPLRIPDGAKYIKELAKTGWPNLAELWNKHAPYPNINPEDITSAEVKMFEETWNHKKFIHVGLDLHYAKGHPSKDIEYHCVYRIMIHAMDAANAPLKYKTGDFMMTVSVGGEESEMDKEPVKGRSYVDGSDILYPDAYMKSEEYVMAKRDEERMSDRVAKVVLSRTEFEERERRIYRAVSGVDESGGSISRRDLRHRVAGVPTDIDVSALKVRPRFSPPPPIHKVGFSSDTVTSGQLYRVACACSKTDSTYCETLIEWYGSKSAIHETLGHSNKLTSRGVAPVFLLPFARGYVKYKCTIARDSFEGESDSTSSLVVEDFFNSRIKLSVAGGHGETIRDALSIVTRHYENTAMYDEVRDKIQAITISPGEYMVTRNPLGCEAAGHRRPHDEKLRRNLTRSKSEYPSTRNWPESTIAFGNAYTMLTYGTCVECCPDFFDPTVDIL